MVKDLSSGNGVADDQPGAIGDPIDLLIAAHIEHAELCNMLERIADSLPDDVDPLLCGRVVRFLKDDLPEHHRDEEDGLFPLLEKRARPSDNVTELLAQLSLEHATDESFAEELMEELTGLSLGARPGNPNMLGYMLRGFFENYRRHLHWETNVLLPLARRRLTEQDLSMLMRSFSGRRLADI